MNLKEKNIHNLTSLWQLAGERYQALLSTDTFKSVVIKDSDWPNRVWIKESSVKPEVKSIADYMALETTLTTLSLFDPTSSKVLRDQGFEKASEQIGMHLKLQKLYPETELKIEHVTEQMGSELWSILFEKAFDYQIPSQVVMQLISDAEFFILFSGVNPVGTALLFSSNTEIMGIHTLGIVPEFRRQGFAEQAMHKLLNTAYLRNFEYAVLQASPAGLGIYQKLGFSSDFTVKNYRLSNHKTQ